MDLTYTFDAANHLLRATIGGPFSLADAKTTFTTILEALVQHQAKKVLIDGRTITGRPETIERFDYGKFVAEATIDQCYRSLMSVPQLAYVLVPPVRDRQRFGEIVAVNRGMNLKVFDNLDEATHWLGMTQSSA